MSKREWVIKYLEEAREILGNVEEPTFWLDCVKNAVTEARELLEPVKPITDNGAVFRTYACGNCKTHFYLRQQKYCAICGRAVKWDETN